MTYILLLSNPVDAGSYIKGSANDTGYWAYSCPGPVVSRATIPEPVVGSQRREVGAPLVFAFGRARNRIEPACSNISPEPSGLMTRFINFVY
jgi:hypothetical protein